MPTDNYAFRLRGQISRVMRVDGRADGGIFIMTFPGESVELAIIRAGVSGSTVFFTPLGQTDRRTDGRNGFVLVTGPPRSQLV